MSALRKKARNAARSRWVAWAGSIAPVMAVLGFWEGASTLDYFGIVPARLVPPPSEIFREFFRILENGTLVKHTVASLARVFGGYGIGALIAIPAGVFLGWYRSAYRVFEPIIELCRPIPAITLLSVAILFLGIGDISKIAIIAWATFFIVFISTLYGAYAVDELKILVMRSLRAGDMSILRKVVLHSVAPSIFAGMRQALAIALIVAVAAEMIISNDGLGFLIQDSQRAFRVSQMYAGIFFLGLFGFGLTKLFLIVEGWLLCWRHPGPTAE